MLFGASGAHLEALGIPDVTGYRQHLHGPVPGAWPAAPPGITGFYTVFPDPDRFLAGELDARFRGFIGSAPACGGVLTAWPEADVNALHGGQYVNLGLTKEKLHRVHQHLKGLCRGSRVKYGAVTSGTGLSQVSFAGPGLDFYCLNVTSGRLPLLQALEEWRGNVSRLQRSPVLAVAEANTDSPAARPSWFGMLYGWLTGYSLAGGGDRVLGLWSGWTAECPWVPGDTATITALTRIAGYCRNDGKT